MTRAEQIAYSKLYSKFNARIEKYGQSYFYKTLRKQSEPFLELLDKYPLTYLLSIVDSVITENAFIEDLPKYYIQVGTRFLQFFSVNTFTQKAADPVKLINEALRDLDKQAALSKIGLEPEVASKIKGITETTRKLIKETIIRDTKKGFSQAQIARDIRFHTKGLIAKQRAALIARTETTYISSRAAEINVMHVNYQVQKRWIPVVDMRTRDSHIKMLGKKPIPKDALFTVGGKQMKYPGDPSGGADQCCNCRCHLIYERALIQEEATVSSFDIGAMLEDLLKPLKSL